MLIAESAHGKWQLKFKLCTTNTVITTIKAETTTSIAMTTAKPTTEATTTIGATTTAEETTTSVEPTTSLRTTSPSTYNKRDLSEVLSSNIINNYDVLRVLRCA